MKTQLTNIALEGTYNGDVVGGLLLWTVENLQALLFEKDELSGLSWINKKAPGTTFTQGPKKGRQKAKFYLLLNILSANMITIPLIFLTYTYH